MLADGYSTAQTERGLKTLGLPFSPEALEEAQELTREKLGRKLNAEKSSIRVLGFG